MTAWARVAACTLALAAALASGSARAQDGRVPQRRIGVHWRGGVPHVAFSALDLVTPGVRQTLDSSLTQRLVMRIYAYRADGQPIAVAPRECRVSYDTWERDYLVDIEDEHTDQTLSFRTLDGVTRRCLVADQVPVGRASDYERYVGETIYFGVIVELNPISPDTVQRIRRWLASSGGGRSGEEAFFGPMVSVFVNRRIGSAERTLVFRSQSVRVPPRGSDR